MNDLTKSRFQAIVTSYSRNKNLDDEINKHSWTIPGVQFEHSSMIKQKREPE